MRYQQLWSRVLVLAIVLLSNFLIAASARAAIDDVPYASDPEAPLTDAQWRQLAAKHQLQMVARTESPKKATASRMASRSPPTKIIGLHVRCRTAIYSAIAPGLTDNPSSGTETTT